MMNGHPFYLLHYECAKCQNTAPGLRNDGRPGRSRSGERPSPGPEGSRHS
jgi:hypothetical protein